MRVFYFLAMILLLPSAVYAAGFDCEKASGFVEKTICSDEQLSKLDDALTQAFKKTMASAKNAHDVKKQQIVWLTTTRNNCQDATCLTQVYKARLVALEGIETTKETSQNSGGGEIVLDRCHMDTCDWFKIEKIEVVQESKKGKLVKVSTKGTEEEYSEAFVNKHGYPKLPSKKAKWDDASEWYLLCSNTLPAVITYDGEQKTYVATIPFDQNDDAAGAMEGAGNLYAHVCNGGKKPHFATLPDSGWSLSLEKPTDIFEH